MQYTQDELNKIIENHKHWLLRDCEGWENLKANLRHADLSNAYLISANLRGADVSDAALSGAKGWASVKYDATTKFFALRCPESGEFDAWKKGYACGRIGGR
jgi:hypothetical protein